MTKSGGSVAVETVVQELQRSLTIEAGAFDAFCRPFMSPSHRWFFSGQGRSGLIAQMAAMRFMHLGFASHAVGEPTAPAIREGDRLLLVSGSGRTPTTRSYAAVGRSEGAMVLLLTADAGSPLAEVADVVLALDAGDSAQFGGSLFEQSALAVLDAVALRVSKAAPTVHAEMATRHSNLQ